METYFKRLNNNNSLYQETKKYSHVGYQNHDLTLKFVFSGVQNYIMNKKELMVHPDCFLMINKGTDFESKIHSQDYVQSLSISFDPKFIHDINRTLQNSTNYLLEHPVDDHTPDFHFPETLLPLKSNLLFNLHHIRRFVKNRVDDDHLLEEYLHHTYINYLEIFNHDVLLAEERLESLKQHTREEVIKRLNLAKDFIYCNYNQQIGLKEIAENSFLSVNHLLRTFKQAFEETPHQFLTKIRLKRANYLIKNTAFPINEIVPAVGFECASSFIRLYRSYFNCTPAKFRKANYYEKN
ncbi:helix-turn-helix transcriptional regulator [Pedobacter polaris]|uniref:Helix-turn-helix transcriptional regulator n=1 Tax=Pedobacter polaris TaxID=2571273 RepID=A0A4U1CHB3_9SPHI|nr:AraC family transcriptional regulator [Pedobacter polaris]TKC06661.1 helix-turn-helix transcriptional regulator [Pedobacter polaris]